MIVKNLAKLRNEAHLSQDKLGELTGLNGRKISNYERGQAKADITTLAKLADFFGVSIDYLLGREPLEPVKSSVNLSLGIFGHHIAEYREAQGVLPKELAKAANITPAYLSLIENGKKIPKLETALRLLNALKISADEAFSDCLFQSSHIKASHVQYRISALDEANRLIALDLIDAIVKSLEKESYNSKK